MAYFAQHLAAVLQHDRLGITLERVPERVISREKEPRVAARLHDRAAGAVRKHPRVVRPVDCVRRARLAGEVGTRRARNEKRLALVARDLIDRERYTGI